VDPVKSAEEWHPKVVPELASEGTFSGRREFRDLPTDCVNIGPAIKTGPEAELTSNPTVLLKETDPASVEVLTSEVPRLRTFSTKLKTRIRPERSSVEKAH
jgi:hypothetical protein